jgi:hypothetical protein
METVGDLMKLDKFRQVVVCVLLLMVILPQRGVRAEEQNFVEIPLETFHEAKPVELSGVISNQTLNIPVPQSWLPGDDNWVEIKTNASPLLDLAESSLTISLNGSRIGSYPLSRISKFKLRVLIPANMLTQGNNALTFTGVLYLPTDRDTNCQNWEDPSRWLSVEPGGILHLSFVRRDLSVSLSNFPRVLIEPLERYLPNENRKSILIVLPDDITQDDLTSLSTVSYMLGRSADPSYDWKPEIVTESQFNSAVSLSRNIIFIGRAPDGLRDLADNDKDYVALLPSPWEQGYAVMIIGDQNRQDGVSPASVFGDPARSVLLNGQVAYVDRRLPPSPQQFPNDLTFEDLGYLNRTVRGIGQQNLVYSLHVPYDVDPVLVKLNLALVHSPDLDIQRSSITVYLNGFSVAGILPTARSSTGEPITVGLPAKSFRPGVNFIRIRFDLHIPYSSCEQSPESVWATVLNNSILEVTYRNRSPIPSLKHFPLPFSDYPGFIYVVPDQGSHSSAEYISRLSFVFGASAYLQDYPPEAITAADFLQKSKDYRNFILIGLPSQNSAIMSVNNLLPQPFTQEGNFLQDSFGVYLPTSDRDASLGLMQIISSPWVQDGNILVLTGNDQQGLEWAWDVILNPASWDQFAGNLMVIGSEKRSNSSGTAQDAGNPQVLFQQIADASNIPIIGPILQRGGQAFVAPALIAVGTALLLVICILWLIRVVRSRYAPGPIDGKDERVEDE